MRVVSFNIQHGRAPSGEVDLGLLAAATRGLAPDLLALQEVDVGVRRSHRADLAAIAAGELRVTFSPALRLARGMNGRYGNALAVRGTLDDVETLPLPGQRGDEPRAAALARVTVEGTRPISVCATHLSVREDVARRQLTSCVRALLDRPAPHLLLGDLNLLPADVAEIVEPAGFTLADTSEPTFPVDTSRIRIDHAAVTEGLHIGTVQVVRTPTSDHRALVVEVTSSQ